MTEQALAPRYAVLDVLPLVLITGPVMGPPYIAPTKPLAWLALEYVAEIGEF